VAVIGVLSAVIGEPPDAVARTCCGHNQAVRHGRDLDGFNDETNAG
jgi:hypothetical protein